MAEIKIDFGLNIAASTPIDKRMVVNKLSDLYTTPSDTFTYVYAGLTVAVLNTTETAIVDSETDETTYKYDTGGISLWVLKNTAPYESGTTITLSRDNFTKYWQRVGNNESTGPDTPGGNATIMWDDLDQD